KPTGRRISHLRRAEPRLPRLLAHPHRSRALEVFGITEILGSPILVERGYDYVRENLCHELPVWRLHTVSARVQFHRVPPGCPGFLGPGAPGNRADAEEHRPQPRAFARRRR